MNLTLTQDVQERIDDHVKSERFASPEEVVAAAIKALDQQQEFGDFESGELDQLIAEGQSSIRNEGTLDTEQAFRLRAERRAQKWKSVP